MFAQAKILISRSWNYWFYGRLSVFRNGYQMNYSDLSSKLTQVIEQIPKDVLCFLYILWHK